MSRRLTLLGGLGLHRDGVREDMISARAESLLTYVAIHRDTPTPRARLAFLLWPDTSDAQARTNLRKVVHQLRRAVPDLDEMLTLTGATIGWRPGTRWKLDVAEFDRQVADEQLEQAILTYRGDLVPSCSDAWIEPIRASYRGRYLAVLRRLVDAYRARGDVDAAAGVAERLLELDPIDEATARVLMRLHDTRGDRGRALRVYHGLVAALRDELDVEPSAETSLVRDALMVGLDAGTRVDDAPTRGAFIGRATERRALVAAWRAARSGWSSAVLVAGESGIGKSRLVEDFGRWCAQRGVRVVTAQAYAAERVLAYGAITEWLLSWTVQRRLPDLDQGQRAELRRLLQGPPGAPGADPAPALPADDRRRLLWTAIEAALVVPRQPMVLVLDDAQWADRESLRLVHHLVRTARDAPVLVVLTIRADPLDGDPAVDEMISGLRRLERLTELDLGPLSVEDTRQLIRDARPGDVAGAAAAEDSTEHPADERPDDPGTRLWRLTGGNPLFVVEALRSGWPASPGQTPAGVTHRVQTVIEDRLARLTPGAKDLLRVAAVLGREFDADLAFAVAEAGDPVPALDELWRQRIIREHGESTYDFAHDQIRLVAYHQMSPAVRRRLHARTARALAGGALSPGLAARVADHLDRAGAATEAVQWYSSAAADAHQLGAGRAAVWHLERARQLLSMQPESPDRHARELAILTALPAPLAAVEGYASARIAAVHSRALEVAALTGSALGAPLLWSLAFAGLVHEQFAEARQWAAQLHDRGERDGDDRLVAEGACLLGIASFWASDLPAARRWFEACLAAFRPEDRDHHLAAYGQDPQIVALARLGNIHALLGDGTAGRAACSRALATADGIGHPLSRAAAYVFAGLLGVDLDDDCLVRRSSGTLTAMRPDALPVRYVGDALRGLVLAMDGRGPDGLRQIRTVVRRATPAPAAPGMLAMLRRIELAAALRAGDPDQVAEAAKELRDAGAAAAVWRAVAERHVAR